MKTLLLALVLSLHAYALSPIPVVDISPDVAKLDRSCKAASDCLATTLTQNGCNTMCGACGFAINAKEKAKLDAIVRAHPAAQGSCPIGKCAPGHCEAACENNLCVGNTVRGYK